jgi:hypothetical protein
VASAIRKAEEKSYLYRDLGKILTWRGVPVIGQPMRSGDLSGAVKAAMLACRRSHKLKDPDTWAWDQEASLEIMYRYTSFSLDLHDLTE